MTRTKIDFLAALAITLSVLVIPLTAKGPTVKLTVTGQNLAQAIDVVSPNALVHVWTDDFLAGPTEVPEPSLPRYRVSFYAQLPDTSIKMVYVVYYVKSATGDGFVYLPGRGEEAWALNVGTILREGKEGQWHHAADQWSQAINSSLP